MGGKPKKSGVPLLQPAIASVFERYPAKARLRLLALRQLIFETAGDLEGVGVLTETLKWGEVSYLTEQSKSGSTIRIGWRASQPEHYALFLNCNTSLVSDFRTTHSDDLAFEDNRAIVIPIDRPLPKEALRFCIEAALTYHQEKR
jgi:hypothetical protein